MRIMNCNVNGLRSATKKGFLEWVMTQNAEVICLQETRLSGPATEVQLPGYYGYYAHAEKPGYSGVAIFTRQKPDQVIIDWGYPLSIAEGRYIAVTYGNACIASLYLPSGTSGDARQQVKYAFMERYFSYLQAQRQAGIQSIITGDWNIAHTPKDLKNWRSNQDHTGFLPEERAWLDRLFAAGYCDAFRVVNTAPDQYTWWSHRGRARENNTGWRIDYQVVSAEIAPAIKTTQIYTAQNFSDHAPLTLDYDWPQA